MSPGPSYQTPAVKGMRYAVSTCHVSNSFNMNFATEPIRHSSNCETKRGVQTKIAMLHLMKCSYKHENVSARLAWLFMPLCFQEKQESQITNCQLFTQVWLFASLDLGGI